MKFGLVTLILLTGLAACGAGKPANPLIGSWKLVGGWREYPDSPLMCPAKSLSFTATSWTVNYADHSTTDDIGYKMPDKTEVYLESGGLGAIGYKILPNGHIQLDSASACEYARQ